MQVIDKIFFAGTSTGVAIAGVAGLASAVCENFILIVGEEKVKLSACSLRKPSFSETKTEATWLDEFEDTTSTLASIGALENP